MRLLIVVFALLVSVTFADARPRGIIAVVGCPQGSALPDGCAGAVPAGVQHSDFFTYARQSGQSYFSNTPINWNAAGIYYSVGIPTSVTLQDPATASLPTGCSYSTSPAPRIACSSTAVPMVFDSLDFSLHGGVFLQINNNVTSDVTVQNSNFKYGGNSLQANYLGTFGTGINSLTLTHNKTDGTAAGWNGTSAFNVASASAPITARYNALLNGPARYINSASSGDTTIQYNYIEGLSFIAGTHGEINLVLFTGTMGNLTITYNTFLQPSTAAANGTTTAFYASGGSANGSTITNTLIDHNVIATNLAGGQGGTVTTGAAGAEFAYINYTNSTISNNYIDPTGSLGCFTSTSAPTFTNPTTFSGNVDLIDGSAITQFNGTCFGHN